jgi:hypothetical protein
MGSVLNYPLYDAIVQGFDIPGPGNLANVSAVMSQIQKSFKVCFSFPLIATSVSKPVGVGPYYSRKLS